MAEKYLMTKNGFEALQRIAYGAQQRAKEIASAPRDKTFGDNDSLGSRVDNNADNDLFVFAIRLKECRNMLNNAEIVDYPGKVVVVGYGTKVVLDSNGVEETIMIRGYGEDLEDGDTIYGARYNAPIAMALKGKKIGQRVKFNGRSLDIISVEPLPIEKEK